jgi:hypothetical protein
MTRLSECLAALLALLSLDGRAGEPVLLLTARAGAASPHPAPVSVSLDLSKLFGKGVNPALLRVTEAPPSAAGPAEPMPAQFEADAPGSPRGVLWWLAPPGDRAERRFRLSLAAEQAKPIFSITADPKQDYYDIAQGTAPVLRYYHGTAPAPPGIATNYARGDYIMPLYGPSGEILTADYPPDHPHHRGLGWSWPVTRWGDEVRDLWAVVGVWSRPVAIRRREAGSVYALLHAENVWKWGDTNPIVREAVFIRAFRSAADGRLLDLEVHLTALADRVAIGGRPHGGYGGFGLRAQPAQGRVITRYTDPPGAQPRRSWLDYSGVFAGGHGPAGLAIFEHVSNPFYPNELKEYPELNYVMPAFPGEREVPLSKAAPLMLRHRLWIHAGTPRTNELAQLWAVYTQPPKVAVLPQ